MIKKYSLLALEKAINTTLSLDEAVESKMVKLQGKVIEVRIQPLDVRFFMLFHQQTLQLLSESQLPADTVVESNPMGLIRLSLLPASKARSLFNDQIKLSGDVEAGQALKQLIDDLDIDWETHMARFTGDVIAHQIGQGMRKMRSIGQQWTQSFCQNVTDFVQEELRITPCHEEIDDFYHDLDRLVLDVERLEATIHLLLIDQP